MSDCYLPLTNGKFAVVDIEDLATALGQTWSYWARGKVAYARCRVRGSNPSRWVTLQNYLMPGAATVDHEDGNGLNNRRSNLRQATKQQNAANRGIDRNNTTGFKGVYRYKHRFRAAIQVDGKQISLGCYDTKEAAARAYDSAALLHFKEFAKTNQMLGRLDP